MKLVSLFAIASCVVACGSDDQNVTTADPTVPSSSDAGGTGSADATSAECAADVHQFASCTTDKAQCTQRCTPCSSGLWTLDPIVFTCQPDPTKTNAFEWSTLDAVDCFPMANNCPDVYTDALCTQPMSCP